MKKLILSLLLLATIVQIAAEPKSIRKAMLFSAILPGLGEMYVGNYNRSATFLAVEAATIFTYFRLKSERQWAQNSYKDFAYSITETPKNSPDWYYQLLQDYVSSQDYNSDIIRDARNYFLIYQNDPVAYEEYLDQYLVPDDKAWDWENNRNWYKFRNLRRDKQNMEIYMKFAFAAAILNRFISVIDAAVLTKNYNKHQETTSSLRVYPDLVNMGLKLNYEIKF